MSKRVCPTRELPTKEEMMHELSTNGYMVIREAVAIEKVKQMHDSFMAYMDAMSPKFDSQDRGTWTSKTLPFSKKGLIQNYGVSWQPHALEARKEMFKLFAILYGTEMLTSSFDGTSFTRKGKVCKYKDLKDWKRNAYAKTPLHIDQTTEGFSSVQGGLALTPQEEDEHVFTCVPKSQLHHAALLAKQEVKEKHWMVMNEAQIEYLEYHNLYPIRVALNPGDVVFWDSRTVHASAPYCKTASPDAYRVQTFVCMCPAIRNKDEFILEMGKRLKGYEEARVSKHSGDYIRLFGNRPRIFSKADLEIYNSFKIPPPEALTDAEKRLHGLMPYEGQFD